MIARTPVRLQSNARVTVEPLGTLTWKSNALFPNYTHNPSPWVLHLCWFFVCMGLGSECGGGVSVRVYVWNVYSSILPMAEMIRPSRTASTMLETDEPIVWPLLPSATSPRRTLTMSRTVS